MDFRHTRADHTAPGLRGPAISGCTKNDVLDFIPFHATHHKTFCSVSVLPLYIVVVDCKNLKLMAKEEIP